MEIFFFTNFETFEMTTMVKSKNVENAGERQLCIIDIYMANAGKLLSQYLQTKILFFVMSTANENEKLNYYSYKAIRS